MKNSFHSVRTVYKTRFPNALDLPTIIIVRRAPGPYDHRFPSTTGSKLMSVYGTTMTSQVRETTPAQPNPKRIRQDSRGVRNHVSLVLRVEVQIALSLVTGALIIFLQS